MRNLNDVRAMIAATGIPGQDAYDLPSSDLTFPDGGHYRMEISGIEHPKVLEAVVDEMRKRKIAIHRLISVVMGSTLLDDAELRDFAQIAADAKVEIIMTPGPRSGWDTGRQLATPEGALSGLRFRGSDQLSYVVAEILRCVDLGFRGFLAIDEGLLWLLNELKQRGDIPQDVVFKVSIFAGHASAAGGRVLQSLGAGTFNPLGDLSLPQLASRALICRSTCTFIWRIRSAGSTVFTTARRWRGYARRATSRSSRAGRWSRGVLGCTSPGSAWTHTPSSAAKKSSMPRSSTN
jgi:hypothetical protein